MLDPLAPPTSSGRIVVRLHCSSLPSRSNIDLHLYSPSGPKHTANMVVVESECLLMTMVDEISETTRVMADVPPPPPPMKSPKPSPGLRPVGGSDDLTVETLSLGSSAAVQHFPTSDITLLEFMNVGVQLTFVPKRKRLRKKK